MSTGQQWIRVTGTNLKPENAVKNVQNVSRLADKGFINACDTAGIKVTKRQASKWNNRKGAAYNLANHVEMNGFVPAVA